MKAVKSSQQKITIYGQYQKNNQCVWFVKKAAEKKSKPFKVKSKLLEYLKKILIEQKIGK